MGYVEVRHTRLHAARRSPPAQLGPIPGLSFLAGHAAAPFLARTHAPPTARPAPTVPGLLVNAFTAGPFLWILPSLQPADWPRWLRLVVGEIGYGFLILFAIFDAWALLYRACGIGVEKLWHCPLAATLADGVLGPALEPHLLRMLRDLLFFPLAAALAAACTARRFPLQRYVAREFQRGRRVGIWLPVLYFVIQGAGSWLESRRAFRRRLQHWPWLGRLWMAALVWGRYSCCFTKVFARK